MTRRERAAQEGEPTRPVVKRHRRFDVVDVVHGCGSPGKGPGGMIPSAAGGIVIVFSPAV